MLDVCKERISRFLAYIGILGSQSSNMATLGVEVVEAE